MSLKPVAQARKRLFLALTSLLTLLPTTLYLQNRTPTCGASLIITAPSHGYLWYTNSLETPDPIIYPNSTKSPMAAIETAKSSQRSIVVLPPLDLRFQKLLTLAKMADLPVVVLRKEVSGAYRGFLEDGGAMSWPDWETWIDGFFHSVAEVVEEQRVLVDWLWFDNSVWRSVIWLHRNGCHVRNSLKS